MPTVSAIKHINITGLRQQISASSKKLFLIATVLSTALLAALSAVVQALPAPLEAGTHNDKAFTYGGSWNIATGSAFYMKDDHRIAKAGSNYQFDFNGTQAKLYGTMAPAMGIMSVSIDGGAAVNIDLYSSTRKSQTLIFTTPELVNGTHNIRVTVTGTKNPAATGRTVNIDRADIIATIITPPTEPTDPTPTEPIPPTEPTNPVPSNGTFHAFGEVTLNADFNSPGAGSNVDTIAFWEGQTPEESLMFVTSKNLSLVEVWRYPFNKASDEAQPLSHPCLQATVDSATNGVIVDQETDLLYVASNWSPNVCVFSLPDMNYRMTINSGINYGLEPNLALMKSSDGTKKLYVSNNRVVFIHDAVTGKVISKFYPAKGLETMWGDNFHQVLYVPDESGRTGVYAYNPDGTAYVRNGTSILGNSIIFNSDAEGIIEYTCPAAGTSDDGAGLIIVSDQIDSTATGNDYEVFDRQSWNHLGKFKLKLPGGSGYVYNTDGIGTTQQASATYPGGVFTAIQDDKSVVGIGWDKIISAISAQTGKPFGCGS